MLSDIQSLLRCMDAFAIEMEKLHTGFLLKRLHCFRYRLRGDVKLSCCLGKTAETHGGGEVFDLRDVHATHSI